MSWATVRTILLVSVVTLLIWAFAEAESLRSADIPVEIIFEPESVAGRRAVDLIDPASAPEEPRVQAGPAVVRATLRVEGAAEALDAVLRRARRGPIRVTPGMQGLPREAGIYTVVLRDALRGHPDLRGEGVTIAKADPESAWVSVDDLVTRELRVVAKAPDNAEGLPECKPSVLKLTLPSREARRLPDDAAASVRLDERTLGALVPGRRETVAGVRAELPREVANVAHATLEPATVDVSVTLGARQVTLKIPSVPVHLRLAPTEMARFDVEVPESDRAILDVSVTGPADVIRQIEDKTIPVVATVPLSFEELERGITSKEAVFAGVPTTLKFEAVSRTVRLKVTRRPPPGPKT